MKTTKLLMSNTNETSIDLLHQVTSFQDDVWRNPYNQAKSYTDYYHNYRKYKNFLSNALFLEMEPYKKAYQDLLEKAIKDKQIVFECTCYPNPCHMDAIRERLTRDLQEKGFIIETNGKYYNIPVGKKDE